MLYGIIEFACWVAVIALAAAFALGLATKWGIIEWLQIHAPNDFFEKMFNCKFCCSFWVGTIISLTLCVVTGVWWLMFAPICTTMITRNLW